MIDIKLWHWPSNRKQLLEENDALREKIKAMEKKEQDMQYLNINLKRESDITIMKLTQKHAKRVSNLERHVEEALKREQQLLADKKLAVARHYNKWVDAEKEIKELRREMTQMEAKKKKNK
jgi:hypothetical protein